MVCGLLLHVHVQGSTVHVSVYMISDRCCVLCVCIIIQTTGGKDGGDRRHVETEGS